MNHQVIEIVSEGDTIDEAMSRLREEVPADSNLISEYVLASGEVTTITAQAWNTEEAFTTALARVPKSATIISREEIGSPAGTITVEASDEGNAQRELSSRVAWLNFLAGQDRKVESVKLLAGGKKRFFGILKGPNQYEAKIVGKTRVQVAYKETPKVRGIVGKPLPMIGWPELLQALRQLSESGTELELKTLLSLSPFALFPFQTLFVVKNKLVNERYFQGIPFSPITRKVIDKAVEYIENPRLSGSPIFMLAITKSDFWLKHPKGGITLFGDRYSMRPENKISRRTIQPVDHAICQVASYLRQFGSYNPLDAQQLSSYAFEAVKHYAEIPVVAYFFELPLFHKYMAYGEVEAPTERMPHIMAYMGVEGLLLELYGELAEGGTVTDQMIIDRVSKYLK